MNGVDIFKNINGAIGAWKGQDYSNFGLDIGRALKDVVLGGGFKKLRKGRESVYKQGYWEASFWSCLYRNCPYQTNPCSFLER